MTGTTEQWFQEQCAEASAILELTHGEYQVKLHDLIAIGECPCVVLTQYATVALTIVELLKEGTPLEDGSKAGKIRDGFFSKLGLIKEGHNGG